MVKSKIYTRSGDIKTIDKLHAGKPFFRKETHSREIAIAQLLRANPHPNIVTFYIISPKHNYIDMELLDTTKKIPKQQILTTLKKVKDHLQSLGIMYIDWKTDQIGITKDGTIKLFDFDLSGVIDTKTKKWTTPAPSFYWSYTQAEARGLTDPYEIDDYAFTLMYPPKGFKAVEPF
jgi:serine/threonine protein kinase